MIKAVAPPVVDAHVAGKRTLVWSATDEGTPWLHLVVRLDRRLEAPLPRPRPPAALGASRARRPAGHVAGDARRRELRPSAPSPSRSAPSPARSVDPQAAAHRRRGGAARPRGRGRRLRPLRPPQGRRRPRLVDAGVRPDRDRAAAASTAADRRRKQPVAIDWPVFGLDARASALPARARSRPPFRQRWAFRARSLVEFPPSIGYGRLYVANNTGTLFAIDAASGRARLALRLRPLRRRLARARPRPRLRGVPEPAALQLDQLGHRRARSSPSTRGTGKIRWQRTIGPSESSPLVANGLVYVGDWRGNVYALRRADRQASAGASRPAAR